MRLLREIQVLKDLEVIEVVDYYRSLDWTFREIAKELGMGLNTLYLAYRRAAARRDAKKAVYDRALAEMKNGAGSGTAFAKARAKVIELQQAG